MVFDTRIERAVLALLGQALEVRPETILAWDLMCHAIEPSRFVGRDEEFLSAPRLDNLESCWCALRALLASLQRTGARQHTPIVCLFDHDEVEDGTEGCPMTPRNLEGCITTIAEIEELTGLDFFAGFGNAFEAVLEAPTGVAVWRNLTGP